MKKALIIAGVSFLVLFANSVFAADAATTANATTATHPCKPIITACKAAGFFKGGKNQGKGLFVNCLKPILDGKAVAGVVVNPTDVPACKAKAATMKEEKMEHME